MRLCRALDGLDESLDGGLVVLSAAQVFLAEAGSSICSLQTKKNIELTVTMVPYSGLPYTKISVVLQTSYLPGMHL
jgi:hypothetical protein